MVQLVGSGEGGNIYKVSTAGTTSRPGTGNPQDMPDWLKILDMANNVVVNTTYNAAGQVISEVVAPLAPLAADFLTLVNPAAGLLAHHALGDNGGGGGGGDGGHAANKWLLGLAAVGVGITCAPVLYKAIASDSRGKRGKRASEVVQTLGDASTRATTLATALLPAFGMPLAYITVQALEDKGIISGGLGDAVQGLITAGVVAPAIGGVLKAVT